MFGSYEKLSKIRILAGAQSPSKRLIAVQSNGEEGGNEAKCVCVNALFYYHSRSKPNFMFCCNLQEKI